MIETNIGRWFYEWGALQKSLKRLNMFAASRGKGGNHIPTDRGGFDEIVCKIFAYLMQLNSLQGE